jgi:hypothetical protein
MIKTLLKTLCPALLLVATACTVPARVDQMVASSQMMGTAASPLQRATFIGTVAGGRQTDPMAMTPQVGNEQFRDALARTLDNAGYLTSSDANRRFRVDATFLGLDHPDLGWTVTVTTIAKYVVTDTRDGSTVLNETITAEDTKTVGDIFVGTERVLVTTEEAVKKNLASFLQKAATVGARPLQQQASTSAPSFTSTGPSTNAAASAAAMPSAGNPLAGNVGNSAEPGGADLLFWNRIRASTDPDDYRAYLKIFPNGAFAAWARQRANGAGSSTAAAQSPGVAGKWVTTSNGSCIWKGLLTVTDGVVAGHIYNGTLELPVSARLTGDGNLTQVLEGPGFSPRTLAGRFPNLTVGTGDRCGPASLTFARVN